MQDVILYLLQLLLNVDSQSYLSHFFSLHGVSEAVESLCMCIVCDLS